MDFLVKAIYLTALVLMIKIASNEEVRDSI